MVAIFLGLPGLEQLLHTGKTLGDVAAGHAAGVEGTHGQLSTGLTDGLGGDDADRLTGAHALAGGQVDAVALGADAAVGVAGQDGADLRLRWVRWRRPDSSLARRSVGAAVIIRSLDQHLAGVASSMRAAG